MKNLMIMTLASLTFISSAMARDTILYIPLADVIAMDEAAGKLDGTVKFFLAGQKTPIVIKKFDKDVSNKKTNGVGKSDEFGCKWSALSALIAFQQSAKRQGANAVIDIVSYYKKNETTSDTNIECHAGFAVVGVTLKGTYAKIEE